jgi:hypothetical protein
MKEAGGLNKQRERLPWPCEERRISIYHVEIGTRRSSAPLSVAPRQPHRRAIAATSKSCAPINEPWMLS